MIHLLKSFLRSTLFALLFLPFPMLVFPQAGKQPAGSQPAITEWSSAQAEHIYGFPEVKAKDKGTLQITAQALSFSSKTGSAAIPLSSILAVDSGKERVELWGVKGQLLRMAMPNGSGLLAATVMHHRIDMLTVEFLDPQNGYHAAVFLLPAKEADRAVKAIHVDPEPRPGYVWSTCDKTLIRSRTIRVPLPAWNEMGIPAVYRALVYEHVIDELQKSGQFDHVYRDGEEDAQHGCAQYTAQISLMDFKAGNQVERASMGPVGMFLGTTQMLLDVRVTEAGGKTLFQEQARATIRGESESTKVAASIAKKLVKKFTKTWKQPGTASAGNQP